MKCRTPTAKPAPKPRNFVAKHAVAVNKAAVHRDRKHDYQRQPKHRQDIRIPDGEG